MFLKRLILGFVVLAILFALPVIALAQGDDPTIPAAPSLSDLATPQGFLALLGFGMWVVQQWLGKIPAVTRAHQIIIVVVVTGAVIALTLFTDWLPADYFDQADRIWNAVVAGLYYLLANQGAYLSARFLKRTPPAIG